MKFSLPFLKKEKEEKIFEEEAITVRDMIAPPHIEVTQDHLKLGERLAKSFFIFSYPKYLSTGWLSPVINLNTPMDISFFMSPISSETVLKRLRKKITDVSSEIMEREEKGLVRDPSLEEAYRNIEDLRDKLMTAQSKMFRLSLYITIYEDNQKELRETELTLRSIFESRLIYIKPALFRQRQGFVSCTPSGLDLIEVNVPMDTEPLSTSFPFVSFDLSSNEGILYGINRHNNSLVLFDRFSLENANSVVFAKAGAGKSLQGSEPVLIKRKGEVQLVKIGSLVEELIEKQGATQIDEELEGVIAPEIEVFSFNKNLKGQWSKVTVAARKEAPKKLYKFKTQSGREITTTADHNMLVLKKGKVTATKSSEIKEGEYVPLPKRVFETDSSLESLNLLKLFKNSNKIYITGAEKLIKENYNLLKETGIDKSLDKYLYKYKTGRRIPIQYFCKILDCLNLKLNSPEVSNLRVVSKNGKEKHSLDINFPITPALLRIIGFISAEGTVKDEAILISNKNQEVLGNIDSSLKKIGVPFYYGNNGIIIACRLFTELIKALGGEGKSEEKQVLPLIFNLERKKISQYLSAYFEGDSGVEDHEIIATSKSEKLISEISYLLYLFGIISRISETKKRPSNCNWKEKRTYWKLSISGQDNLKRFAQNINFISERKQKQLSKITQKENNTNVNVVPEVKNIFEEIYQLFGFQLSEIPEISEWKRGIRRPSPKHLKKVIKKIRNKIEHFKNLEYQFKVLSELPELNSIIKTGKDNKDLNSKLWQELGESWRLMKNKEIKPKSKNAFRAINIVKQIPFSLIELKNKTHLGFQEMNIHFKNHNRSLQGALTTRPKSNTQYQIIQQAAQFVWKNYQQILNQNIPKVEEKLTLLKNLADSDLFWDPIVEIKEIKNKKEKYVYDLTVDNEVFLAGKGGMFVHNSYAIKLEILRSLMQGINIIILDPENEYEFLTDAVGGSFFKISLTSPNHINPFDLPEVREDEDPENVLRSNIINLVGLMRVMLGGLNPEEDSIIDQALTETYAVRDITLDSDPKTWQENTPIMSDFEEVLESMEGAESLVRKLRKFTKGAFAGFFNQPSNISLKNNLVVFGIRDMEEELREIASFIIMRYIWNMVKSKLKKRILVVDEAWWIMQSEDGASFLYGLAKRARKYWLGLTTITQDVADFMKSEYGQPIITNSSMQLLMKQSPATIDAVQDTFNLTDMEKQLLLEAAVGEGIFFAGMKHVAISIVASYTEDQLITTAPEEVIKIKEAKKKLRGK